MKLSFFVMYRRRKLLFIYKLCVSCNVLTVIIESAKSIKRERVKCRLDRFNLHHASRENSHNTSSYIGRFGTRYGRSVTIPICTLLLICASTAQRLQFIFFAQCWGCGRRVIGADNNVDYVIGWIGVDVRA